MLTQLGKMRNITMPIFFKTGLSKAEILRFFDFPNGRCRHLLFLKSPNFLANSVQRVRTHEHVKFWQNRSISCEDIKIIQFFNMAAAAILDCQIHKILLAWGPRRITLPNFGKIVVPLRKCCNFSNFQDGRRSHFGLLKLLNFIVYWGPEGWDASARQFCQNPSIGCKYINIFWFFKMAAAAILDCRIHKILSADSVWMAQAHHFY